MGEGVDGGNGSVVRAGEEVEEFEGADDIVDEADGAEGLDAELGALFNSV